MNMYVYITIKNTEDAFFFSKGEACFFLLHEVLINCYTVHSAIKLFLKLNKTAQNLCTGLLPPVSSSFQIPKPSLSSQRKVK